MTTDRHKRLHALHSWVGMMLGLFVYFVCFTGMFALFEHELQTWENPDLREQGLTVPPTAPPISAFAKEAEQQGTLVSLSVIFPSEPTPYYLAIATIQPNTTPQFTLKRKWRASDGSLLPERGEGLSHWLLDIHRHLMLPETLGRTLIGIAGILVLVLIASGLLTHRHIIRDFFKLRLARSERLKWQDTHKMLGLFTLPFSLMIAFTGAILGVVAILGPAVALIAFKGDTETLYKKVLGEPVVASGVTTQMRSIDDLYALKHPKTSQKPSSVFIQFYGDKNAEARVFYPADTKLARFEFMDLSADASRSINISEAVNTPTPANRVNNSFATLHYATYGPILLKWVYAAFGFALCCLIATGAAIWIERRKTSTTGKHNPHFYQALSRCSIGFYLSLPIATAALFIHDKLYFGTENDRLLWVGITYSSVVVSVCLISLFYRNSFRLARHLAFVLGVITASIALVNSITTNTALFHTLQAGRNPLQSDDNGVDIAALVLGIIILLVSYRLPRGRNAATPNSRPRHAQSS